MNIRNTTKRELELDRKFGGKGKFREHVLSRLSESTEWEDVRVIAEQNGIHYTTLYGWIRRWNAQSEEKAIAA